jgi:cytochrome b involved in lipid metabolism
MDILEKLGYDQALNSIKSRAFMISFQVDDVPLTVDIHDILDGDYHKTAWEYLLNHVKEEEGMNDQCTEEDDYTLFTYPHPKSYTSSYLFENNSQDHLQVALDMSKSET